MTTRIGTRTARLTATLAVTAGLAAACGGDGDGASCVDSDADNPSYEGTALVALSEAVPDLPEIFENDPPVPATLSVDSVSEVSTVDVGSSELDVENGVSVVMTGNFTVSRMSPIYRSLVGACSESGTADGGDEFQSIVGFTDGRAVRFHVESGTLTVSEYDR